MPWSSLQPQTPRLRQRTRPRPRQLLTPTWGRPDQFRAANTARRGNEVACPYPPPRFPAAVAPSPTSTAVRNPHSHRLWPAGSFLGDFRTPAGARNSSRIRTFRLWGTLRGKLPFWVRRSTSDPGNSARLIYPRKYSRTVFFLVRPGCSPICALIYPKIERIVPPSARWVTPFIAALVMSCTTPRPCSAGSISFWVRLEGCTSL
jgi:hypothetical protein